MKCDATNPIRLPNPAPRAYDNRSLKVPNAIFFTFQDQISEMINPQINTPTKNWREIK